MKAKVTKLVETVVEVELPEKCPKCGADFTSEDYNLRQAELSSSVLPAMINGGVEIGGVDPEPGDVMVTGYFCGECNEMLHA